MSRRSLARGGGALAAAMLLSLTACVAPREAVVQSSSPLVWPPAPAEPRIRHVQDISCPADLGMRPSFWGRVVGFLIGGREEDEKLGKPFGVSVDEGGNLYVTDTARAALWCFNRAERRFWRLDAVGTNGLVCPVAAVRCGEKLLVADSGLGKVLASDLKGRMLFECSGVTRPSGLTICGETLFVADVGEHGIEAFDLKGTLLRRFGKRGTGPGEFNAPTHITSDVKNRLIVTDSLNSRIQILDLEGRHLATLGGPGDSTGRFGRPKGVAVDSFGHIYVTDALSDTVQVFDGNGQFLLNWGEAGSASGEFWMPSGIAVGAKNEIFVADSYNRRIQVFQYVGKE